MKLKRVVVSKNANKIRQPKSISFDLTSAFEVELLNYAEDEKHGNFSEFMKRLIARDLEGRQTPRMPQMDVTEIEDDKEAMGGFL